MTTFQDSIRQARVHFFEQLSIIAHDYGYKCIIDYDTFKNGKGFITTGHAPGSAVVLEFTFSIVSLQSAAYIRIHFYKGNVIPELQLGIDRPSHHRLAAYDRSCLRSMYCRMFVPNPASNPTTTAIITTSNNNILQRHGGENLTAQQRQDEIDERNRVFEWLRSYLQQQTHGGEVANSNSISSSDDEQEEEVCSSRLPSSVDVTYPDTAIEPYDGTTTSETQSEIKEIISRAIDSVSKSQSLLTTLEVNYSGLINENLLLNRKLQEQSTLLEKNRQIKRKLEEQNSLLLTENRQLKQKVQTQSDIIAESGMLPKLVDSDDDAEVTDAYSSYHHCQPTPYYANNVRTVRRIVKHSSLTSIGKK